MSDTIVLGAGVIGVTTAYYLNRAGHRVTVIERQSTAGLETSLNNGCIIHASEVDPWSQPGMPRTSCVGSVRRARPCCCVTRRSHVCGPGDCASR